VKTAELRAMTTETLLTELGSARKELLNFRIRVSTRQLSDVSQVRKTKKKIAQIMTLLRERELAQRS